MGATGIDEKTYIAYVYNLKLDYLQNELQFSKELTCDELDYPDCNPDLFEFDDVVFPSINWWKYRNHFFSVIKQMNEQDLDVQTERLFQDALNMLNFYFQALLYGMEDIEVNELIERMISIILAYGQEDFIYHSVLDYYNKRIEMATDPERGHIRRAINCIDIFRKYADYQLFIEQNFEKTMKYYKLMTLDWGDEDYTLKEDVVVYNFIRNLILGNDNFTVENVEKIENCDWLCKKIFVSYLGAVKKNEDNSVSKYAEEYFGAFSRLVNQRKSVEEMRIPLLMAYYVKNTAVFSDIFLIDDYNRDFVGKNLSKFLYSCLSESKMLGYTSICEYAKQHEYSLQFAQRCFEMIIIEKCVRSILQLLRVDVGIELNVAYYTSLETFMHMLPCDSQKENVGKLALMNVAYMNDPSEGKILETYFNEERKNKKEKQRVDASTPYVFVKSFTSQIDFLPMWEMYGDHAQGCCLVLDWNDELLCNEVPFYYVCYISKIGKKYTVEIGNNSNIKSCELVNQNLNKIKYLYENLNQKNDKIILDLINKSIDKIRYLFKINDYSYEKEVRVCYQYSEVTSWFYHTKDEYRKLYVMPKLPIRIKEIIFGPRFENKKDIIPFIKEQVDKLSDICNYEAPKMTFSNIVYR